MSGGEERAGVTPERLAELADGATPATDAEREMVTLMADVRVLDDAPASPALRARVHAIAAGEPEPSGGRLRAWWRDAGHRRLALAGAPVAVAVAVALAIAIPAMSGSGGGGEPVPGGEGAVATEGPEAATPDAAAARAAAPAADAAAGLKLSDPAERDQAVARARRIVAAAGGTVLREEAGAREDTRVLVAQVPAGRVDEVLSDLQGLGTTSAPAEAPASGDSGAGPVTLEVTISP